MQWGKILERLERDIIKTDVMASSDSDFMATHMPFKNLHLIEYGYTNSGKVKKDEQELYKDLIYNPDDGNRTIIVRGDNGVGKSHLIRWLKSKLTSDYDYYDPDKEQVIFIRRLENTLRGAIAQLLEKGVVQDKEINDRMIKFINSVDSLDEDHYKSNIYYNIIAEIENDQSNDEYTPAEKRDLVALLNDTRIKEVLVDENGPISRFYAQIAKPKEIFVGGEAAFVPSDFDFERSLVKDVHRDGSSEARRFIKRIVDEKDKLTKYLNGFTPSVISRCANINQGDAREIFVQLRRDLKKQGKKLTVFIEDFTAFTGIDKELISVLQTEHGGGYADFCPVVSVIGITNAYYERFYDNFKDRFSHQIEVGEEAYGSIESLTQMTALYINASFCSNNTIEKWYSQGANLEDLPQANIDVDEDLYWDYVEYYGKSLTLYPFNKKAIYELYNRLNHKTPREFLRQVLLTQLSAYLRDRYDGNHHRFPVYDGLPLKLKQLDHNASIDNMELSKPDRRRLQILLCIWGDGHLFIEDKQEGFQTIGGLPSKFFHLMGFNDICGITSKNTNTKEVLRRVKEEEASPTTPPFKTKRKEEEYEKQLNSINEWFENYEPLYYSEDMRRNIFQFLGEAIDWQYEGVPAYLANRRYDAKSLLYIEGQMQKGNKNEAVIYMERTPLNRDVLIALAYYHLYNNKNWGFKEAPYYQFQLISWLEVIKFQYTSSVKGVHNNKEHWPMFKWSMTAEFLRLGVMGFLKKYDDSGTLREMLFSEKNLYMNNKLHYNESNNTNKWEQVKKLLEKRIEEFSDNQEYLIQLENTYMGSITRMAGRTYFFDIDEVYRTINELENNNWDIENEMPQLTGTKALDLSLELVKVFTPRVKELLREQQDKIRDILCDLVSLVGDEITHDNLKIASNKSIEFFNTMNQHGVNYSSDMKSNVEYVLNNADIIAQECEMLKGTLDTDQLGQLLKCYSSNPHSIIKRTLNTLSEVHNLAKNKSTEFKKLLSQLDDSLGVDKEVVNSAQTELEKIFDAIEGIEVSDE